MTAVRWPRHAGNDGLTRITVPVAYVEENAGTMTGTDAGAETSTETSTSAGTDAGLRLVALAALERQIGGLENEVAALKTERDALASMPAQVAALRATLEAVTGERDRLADQVKTALARPASGPSVVATPPRAWRWPFRRAG